MSIKTTNEPEEFTSWAVLAAGEGGSKIASQFFERTDNPGIQDRILLMNTNNADLRNNIQRIAPHVHIDQQELERRYTVDFGPIDGAGNKFHWGEESTRQDEDRVLENIAAAELDTAGAFLFITTLGGGTGCGSVPYLINKVRNDPPSPAFGNITNVALAAWPFEYEGAQRDFNAIAGLSRLLNWYDGSQTADIVLLVDNSRLAELATDADSRLADSLSWQSGTRPGGGDRGGLGEKETVNRVLIKAIDMMIAAGRETHGVTDIVDIMAWPSQRDTRHLVPGLALDVETIFDFELAFDMAAESVFAPVDPSTASGTIAVIRAPRSKIDVNGRFTEPGVMKALDDWHEANGFNPDETMKMHALVPSDEKTDTYDVMLLFTGPDIDSLVERSMPAFEGMLEDSREGQFMEKFDRPEKDYSKQDFVRLKQNLERYLA